MVESIVENDCIVFVFHEGVKVVFYIDGVLVKGCNPYIFAVII